MLTAGKLLVMYDKGFVGEQTLPVESEPAVLSTAVAFWSPTIVAMRLAGLRDEQIEALLAEVWSRGVLVTFSPAKVHVEWHAGTAILAGETADG